MHDAHGREGSHAGCNQNVHDRRYGLYLPPGCALYAYERRRSLLAIRKLCFILFAAYMDTDFFLSDTTGASQCCSGQNYSGEFCNSGLDCY